MLVNPRKYLIEARKNKYAIGAFNTSDLEMTQAIIAAGNKLSYPIIVQVSPKAIEYAGLENLSMIVKNEAQKSKASIALHLDHGKSIDLVFKCLEVGFTSVMFDGSDLLFEENIKKTKEVVDLAKKYGACVEGELGRVGHPETVSGSNNGNEILDSHFTKVSRDRYVRTDSINNFTDPAKAKEFVEATGVDTLAVSIGNVHGVPSKDEKLDFDLLEQIAEKVQIPLVLHGASSTPEKDIKKVISLGIAKINIDTDIRMAFSGNLKAFQKSHPDIYDPREILESAKEAVEKVVEGKIKIFNNTNIQNQRSK